MSKCNVQSSKCKCGVAFATALITGLLRSARNDKRLSVLAHRALMTWIPVSSTGMTGFFLTFLFCRHPGAGRDPLRRRYLCRIRDGINYWIASLRSQ